MAKLVTLRRFVNGTESGNIGWESGKTSAKDRDDVLKWIADSPHGSTVKVYNPENTASADE